MTNDAPAICAANAPVRDKPSNYPEPFASRMEGRIKQPLGDLFGLRNFGVNHTLSDSLDYAGSLDGSPQSSWRCREEPGP